MQREVNVAGERDLYVAVIIVKTNASKSEHELFALFNVFI